MYNSVKVVNPMAIGNLFQTFFESMSEIGSIIFIVTTVFMVIYVLYYSTIIFEQILTGEGRSYVTTRIRRIQMDNQEEITIQEQAPIHQRKFNHKLFWKIIGIGYLIGALCFALGMFAIFIVVILIGWLVIKILNIKSQLSK